MMSAFALSAATASDAATTTRGLGSGLDSGSWWKNCHSYLKLIPCCFLPNSCPHTKFHPNRTKNIEVKKIGYQLALVGWSGQSKIAVFISTSFYFVFSPILIPKPNRLVSDRFPIWYMRPFFLKKFKRFWDILLTYLYIFSFFSINLCFFSHPILNPQFLLPLSFFCFLLAKKGRKILSSLTLFSPPTLPALCLLLPLLLHSLFGPSSSSSFSI